VLTVTQVRVPYAYYDEQVHAAERMREAFPILTAYAERLESPANPMDDPNRTGLIGVEFNEMTTTIGSLTSKRTSTNPDFAALIVRFLHELGFTAGAKICLLLSGSFPALNLAAIVACEELDLDLLIISSVGASSFGANHPEMTWLDMERLLQKHGIIAHSTDIASLGAENDLGNSYFEGGRLLALAAIERNGLTPLLMDTLAEQRRVKLEEIRSFRPEALINVGGNQLNIGSAGHLLLPVIIRTTSLDHQDLGIVGWALDQDFPIIHLLKIRDLALQFGLPLDPIPLPSPGNSSVYYRTRVHMGWAVTLLIPICLYVIFLAYRHRAEHTQHH
jgi:poly-gamma-glutamate system protein